MSVLTRLSLHTQFGLTLSPSLLEDEDSDPSTRYKGRIKIDLMSLQLSIWDLDEISWPKNKKQTTDVGETGTPSLLILKTSRERDFSEARQTSDGSLW